MLRESSRTIATVLLMKLLSKVVDVQFGCLAPENFASVNGSCQLAQLMPGYGSGDTFASWIFSVRYMLAVLGGLLANACLGYALVLQICGHLMLISTVLLSISVYFDFVCNQSAITVIAWLCVPILFGIIQPCVLYCVYKWHRSPRAWTMLTAFYFISMKIGEAIGFFLPWLQQVIGRHFTLICIGFSIVFIALSSRIPAESHQTPLVLPTRARMIRYFKIFSPLMLYSVSEVGGRSAIYEAEIRYYLRKDDEINATLFAIASNDAGKAVVPSELLKVLSEIVWSLLLLLVAYRSVKHLSIPWRLQLGILLKAIVTLGLLFLSLLLPRQPQAVQAAFFAASVADAASELLVAVAAYEIIVGVSPRSCKLLLIGIGITVWGLASLVGRVLVIVLNTAPTSNPVLRPTPGKKPLFFVYHIIILLLLMVSSAYYRFVAIPMTEMLWQGGNFHGYKRINAEESTTDDVDEEDGQREPDADEISPLFELSKLLEASSENRR